MTTLSTATTPTTTPVTPRPTDPRLAQLRAQVAARMAAADAAERPAVTWDDLTPAQQAAVRRRVEARYARMHTRLGLQRIVRRDGSPLAGSTPPVREAGTPILNALATVPAEALLAAVPARVLKGQTRMAPTRKDGRPMQPDVAPPGEVLKQWRLERGWSLADLDAQSGISRSYIQAIEAGRRSHTGSVAVRLRLAVTLGHPDWKQELAASQYQEQGAG